MKKSLLFFISLLWICSCSKTREEKIAAFWQWFDTNKEQYANLTQEDQAAKLSILIDKLHDIDSELSVEIASEIQEIVISAEGDTSRFALVEEIVSKAPALEEWDVTAFRQPRMEDFTLQYEEITLTPSELYFLPVEDNDQLDIIVYGLGFSQYKYTKLAHYGMIMLDKVMGEYNVATKVRYYDFKDLAEAKNSEELIPLSELNDYIEAFHAESKEKNI
ncbi:hypothetical protein Q0590_04970 [Rhodocytophaga aerolata]|uniref:DUF4844 domain-containing protein n=1 Tax=Rhodocytophaga aerolata TaxID=455078 RepID=A0ABT8R4C3_9BACT|nr:hypothetical protein [Rhodocytophaga aerolata]MDO1445587.1 hypothetical protein [Rhodocytophaga aerolata]